MYIYISLTIVLEAGKVDPEYDTEEGVAIEEASGNDGNVDVEGKLVYLFICLLVFILFIYCSFNFCFLNFVFYNLIFFSL